VAKAKKKSIAEASTEMFALLESFEPDERVRIVSGTLTLLGDPVPTHVNSGGSSGTAAAAARTVTTGTARAYLDAKAPRGVSELLAAAARFHEENNNGAPTTKADFAAVIHTQGRRNFDSSNFARDIFNAQTAGYFNKGGSADDGYQLSNVGQDYIDALPDREKALAARANSRTRKSPKKGKGKTVRKGRTT
jgi:hypothetical protein